MAAPASVEPVKLFVAALWADAQALAAACERLAARWGAIDFTGPDHAFDVTDYYEREMGPALQRRLLTFATLVAPDVLPEAKLACNAIEDELRVCEKMGTGSGAPCEIVGDSKGRPVPVPIFSPQGRRVNLDLGYLDHSKLVLASAKGAGQKIYLAQGIYADLIGRYESGRYQPFPWTFPDFRDGRYDAELATIRKRYLEQVRQRRGAVSTGGPAQDIKESDRISVPSPPGTPGGEGQGEGG